MCDSETHKRSREELLTAGIVFNTAPVESQGAIVTLLSVGYVELPIELCKSAV